LLLLLWIKNVHYLSPPKPLGANATGMKRHEKTIQDQARKDHSRSGKARKTRQDEAFFRLLLI
jgi:hypothetical protein